MEQMNLIPPEVMAEISDGNSTKLPDNTRKMLQIMASLNTPKELLASMKEIAEFSLPAYRWRSLKREDKGWRFIYTYVP
ncbi:MAG: hypothetical protein KME54_28645 [Tolypothrix brevis GSE-NOS-MK-07-07A]|jgi:hypothetical protein|nr:hypothetical protein [Tolypothrix brevis GSE-NOS-MK-07-07A]